MTRKIQFLFILLAILIIAMVLVGAEVWKYF